MSAHLFDRLTYAPPDAIPKHPEGAFAARSRFLQLRDVLTRAAKSLRTRWNEPTLFFFDAKREAELAATRPAMPDRFAELTLLIESELPALFASVEVRRVARAVGLKDAARLLAFHCAAANDLAELLAIPDDEVFLVVTPATGSGKRLHIRGAANVMQLHKLLTPGIPVSESQLFMPAAIQPNGTLPEGFPGCQYWLWSTQPLTAIPRVNGERVVLVGSATVRASLEVPVRFPALKVESELIEVLNSIQVAEVLSRLCGRPIAVPAQKDLPSIARAA